MSYSYTHPHPAVTTDIVLFTIRDHRLEIMLIRRGNDPFKDGWALPGGFVDFDEDLAACALRELEEETGVAGVYLEQLHTFGTPGRDPRERVISVAYYAPVPPDRISIRAASDAKEVAWFKLDKLPPLAFDHESRPVISRTKQRRVRASIEECVASGIPVVSADVEPRLLERGCWVPPTLVVAEDPGHPLVQEESFAPLAVLLTASHLDDALRLANQVPQGLVASLYSRDAQARARFLDEVEAGVLKLGQPTRGVHLDAPVLGLEGIRIRAARARRLGRGGLHALAGDLPLAEPADPRCAPGNTAER